MLSASDVCVDSHTNPSFVTLHLRHSKTDVFGIGALIYLGLVDGPICPVKALLSFLSVSGEAPGPLFTWMDGTPLSREGLVRAVRSALESQGVVGTHLFNGHSFRIGAATTAAARGVADSLTQSMSRWKSSAFTTYI